MALWRWIRRQWGVRHVRYFFFAWRVARWARLWAECGIGTGHPNKADLAVLAAIWRGEW